MTYQQIISAVERELRSYDAFPDAATKVQEQIDVIHRYAIALAKQLPLNRLVVEKSGELVKESIFNDLLYEVTLPADINEMRPDLGISAVILQTHEGEERRHSVFESIPFESLKAAVQNFYQDGNSLFTLEVGERTLFAPTSVNDGFFILYAKKVPATTTAALEVEVPLDQNSTDVLIEAVCSHFTSVNAKDLSASQIHATLSQILKE